MTKAISLSFITTRMPEVSEEALAALAAAQEGEATGSEKPFWKQYNMIGGFMSVLSQHEGDPDTDARFEYSAQFAYVGAQVTVATFFINYCNENGHIPKTRASFLLSMSLLTFTGARFIGTALLTWIQPDFMMMVYASAVSVVAMPYLSYGADQAIALSALYSRYLRRPFTDTPGLDVSSPFSSS